MKQQRSESLEAHIYTTSLRVRQPRLLHTLPGIQKTTNYFWSGNHPYIVQGRESSPLITLALGDCQKYRGEHITVQNFPKKCYRQRLSKGCSCPSGNGDLTMLYLPCTASLSWCCSLQVLPCTASLFCCCGLQDLPCTASLSRCCGFQGFLLQ